MKNPSFYGGLRRLTISSGQMLVNRDNIRRFNGGYYLL
jgi:hypothetical protein